MAAEDYYDLFYEPFDYEDGGVTCKYCKCDQLEWRQINGNWKLFDPETEQLHECRSNFDIFKLRK